MRVLLIFAVLIGAGCATPMTREQQIKAYKTCTDAGKKPLPLRDDLGSGRIYDVECEP